MTRRADRSVAPAEGVQRVIGDKFRRPMPGAERLLARVDDDREVLHRRIDQIFGTVPRRCIERRCRLARWSELWPSLRQKTSALTDPPVTAARLDTLLQPFRAELAQRPLYVSVDKDVLAGASSVDRSAVTPPVPPAPLTRTRTCHISCWSNSTSARYCTRSLRFCRVPW